MSDKPSSGKAPEAARRRFRENRFGMFIHYGLYSMLGRHEWAMFRERIPAADIRALAKQFDPKPLDMSAWVALAKSAGMRYLCLTTRHHEGFALFDSVASEFNSVEAKAGRDLVREFVDACRAGGVRPCFYYSVANWSDPGFVAGPKADPAGWARFVDIAHEQLRELMTNYGEIDYLFYDGCPPPHTWGCVALNAELRRLQPNLLISDRCQCDEDVASAEQHLIGDPGKLWECCMTTNQSWGYNYGDTYFETPRDILQNLLTCVHNGGNYLLNVGPRGDGSIPDPVPELFETVGRWVERHAEAVYGTDPHPFDYCIQYLTSGRDNTAYVPFHYYHGRETVLAGFGNRVLRVEILGSGEAVDYSQRNERLFLTGLPETPPDPLYPVLKITLDGPPKGVPNPLRTSPTKYE